MDKMKPKPPEVLPVEMPVQELRQAVREAVGVLPKNKRGLMKRFLSIGRLAVHYLPDDCKASARRAVLTTAKQLAESLLKR